MEFSKKLKELREERHLKQTELAKILYVTPEAITMWETGKRTPNLEMLKKIADFFGVTLDELAGREV